MPVALWFHLTRRRPLMASLLCCLGIQAGLSLLLLALGAIADPSRGRSGPAEAIVSVKDRGSRPA